MQFFYWYFLFFFLLCILNKCSFCKHLCKNNQKKKVKLIKIGRCFCIARIDLNNVYLQFELCSAIRIFSVYKNNKTCLIIQIERYLYEKLWKFYRIKITIELFTFNWIFFLVRKYTFALSWNLILVKSCFSY